MKSVSIPKSLAGRRDYLGEKFSRAFAWIDLMLMADENGIVSCSYHELASRWKWSVWKVTRFIEELENECLAERSVCKFRGHITKQSIIIKSISYNYNQTITERSVECLEKRSPLCPSPSLPNPPAPPYTLSSTPPISPSQKGHVCSPQARAYEQDREEIPPPTPSQEDETLPQRHCQNILDYWNKVVRETRSTLPTVRTLSDKRKKKMRLRWKEFARVGDPVEICREVFRNVCTSRFCQGGSKGGWLANFDWVFENDENWVKVYEGNYENREAPREMSLMDKYAENARRIDEMFYGRFESENTAAHPDEQ